MSTQNRKLMQQMVIRAAVLAITVGMAASAWAQRATPAPQLPAQGQQGITPPLARTQDLNLLVGQLSRGEEQPAMTTWKRFVTANAGQLRERADVDRLVSRVVAEASRKAQSLPVPQERAQRAEPGRPPASNADNMQDLQLQKTLQKQPKTMEMLSNISKKMSETAASIIQNIK